MTLTALEKALVAFNKRIEEWEQCGLRGSTIMHECRTLAGTAIVFQGQVIRAVNILKDDKLKPEEKIAQSIKELGDYVIIQ